MTACAGCGPWTLPLYLGARSGVFDCTVGLLYQEWLIYHLHVVIHQHNQWSGELPLDQTLSQTL